MVTVGILGMVGGTLMLCGGIFGWRGMLRDYRVRPFVRVYGPQSARGFLAIAGLFFIVLGALIALRVIGPG
jgi:hypothetical protein